MVKKSSQMHIIRNAALFLFLGLVLFACLIQSEYLLMPIALEGFGHLVYRGAFFLTLPVRAAVWAAVPPVNHHWSLTNAAAASFGAPFFWWAMWRIARVGMRRVLHRGKNSASVQQAHGIGRRQFLIRSAAGVAGCAAGSFGGYTSFVEPEWLKVRYYNVPIRDLPSALDGLRIIHVSDTHYGPYTALPYLERVADRANRLGADLVVLTGDYVHKTPRAIERGIGVLENFRGRLGSAAVLGNHEYWEGAESCRKAFARIGVPLLDNRHVYVTPRGFSASCVPGGSLCLAGVGDLWEGNARFDQAFEGVPGNVPRIVLSHNPQTAERVRPDQRVDLMLAGHTHGGQVKMARHGAADAGGLCYGSGFPIIISRGIGLAFIPARFRVPPELGVITLVRARGGAPLSTTIGE